MQELNVSSVHCHNPTIFKNLALYRGQKQPANVDEVLLVKPYVGKPVGGGGGGGGGGTQVQRGAAPALRISRRKGSFFTTSACPRICKRRVLFCTQVRSMGVKIP